MKRKAALSLVFAVAVNLLHGQHKITGSVVSESSRLPIEYVNIGIAGKGVGTVADQNGKFSLTVAPQHEHDSLLFSCIGFEAQSVKIADIKENGIVSLKEKLYFLDEVVIRPKKIKERVFGVTSKSKLTMAWFPYNTLGYEMGLLMKNRNKARIKSANINIAVCKYDSIFFRLNIYEVEERSNVENILREPIYISFSREEALSGTLQVDLKKHNIVVNGNFLVTLELVKGARGGNGISFSAGLKQKTWSRKTSQAKWETTPVGISISVVADVEK